MSLDHQQLNEERKRLEQQRLGEADWRLWGPYLSERAWGTVREDYSPHGTAWEYFDHDQARSRAYRWSEDGLGGISDEKQRLCFALALWNGRDPILKERAFGLTGNQGNRGEDVKEYYFYTDALPSHGWLRYLYKYPQSAYPYSQLVEENRRRNRLDSPFNLLDSGVFSEGRYWDVDICYAKVSPTRIQIRISLLNCSNEKAELHLIPQLWFRNSWSWGDTVEKPRLQLDDHPEGARWSVRAEHVDLGNYRLHGDQQAELLFTENETHAERFWGLPSSTPYVKDAFHRLIVNGESSAVNPERNGTKFGAWYRFEVGGGESKKIDLVLAADPVDQPFKTVEKIFAVRRSEADVFYDELLPEGGVEDHRIMRQALAGMIWSKQFFHFDVQRWLVGDQQAPPASRKGGRNRQWRHLRAADVLSMPDAWEYPWFAAWDLAFHCVALALVDVDFAKQQIEVLLGEDYLHPNGQIPAYEWALGDVNPPVHAWGALKVYRAERIQRGEGDRRYLQRVFHKLLLNYAWWINRKDKHGQNLFEGGFLGLDNISVFDRSKPLPSGHILKQADATGWMAMFALNMTVMALELAIEDNDYENIAIQCYEQFLSIAKAISGGDENGPSLWDLEAGFFKDLLMTPDGSHHRIDVYSWVGLIPMFATEVVDKRLLENVPRFRRMLQIHKKGLFQGSYVCACPDWENDQGEHLLALVDHTMLPRILSRLLNEDEFLSPYGVRSLSKLHEHYQDLGDLPGIGPTGIRYLPGESESGLFGGNSNWRGPVWIPTNYALVQALEKFHRFLGDEFKYEAPCLPGRSLTLRDIATLISERLVDLYRRDEQGRIPALRRDSPFQSDEAWSDLNLFYEFFHAETGQGLGAAHQTGWTGLLANLVMRRYRKDIPVFLGHEDESMAR
ncbi:MAG: glucosidase [Candidatus Thiodiazotropha sp. (ex Dulcina madagascariensis)]|nr:glucosidase [Candidatus Thiodiazotropha sp. (ex Dulcina madagascariensis)]MCU7927487.1 glucosidase [Candidatus Thiodiazotropha sp. (ex Dulcina madagascariensis)]